MFKSVSMITAMTAAIAMTVTSCTRRDNAPEQSDQNQQTQTDGNAPTVGGTAGNLTQRPLLQGTFQSTCDENEVLQTSERIALEFAGDRITQTQTFFSEDDCSQQPIGKITYRGQFKVEDTPGEVDHLDVTFSEVVIEPDRDNLVKVMNGLSFCGHSDYAVGKPVNVTSASDNMTCFVSKVPENLFGSFILDGSNLYLSDDSILDFDKQASNRDTDVDRSDAYARGGTTSTVR